MPVVHFYLFGEQHAEATWRDRDTDFLLSLMHSPTSGVYRNNISLHKSNIIII